MSQSSSDYVTPLINLLAVIVAAVALVFAVVSEKRARKQFEEGIKLEERIAWQMLR